MNVLRSDETEAKYVKRLADTAGDTTCILCERVPLQEFTHWKIIENHFPYDLIAKTHHMLTPKKHLVEDEVPIDAWKEFRKIKRRSSLMNIHALWKTHRAR